MNGKAPIHSSAMVMIDITEKEKNKCIKRYEQGDMLVQNNSENDLTKYTLGLFNDNFDKILEYEHHYLSENEWLVVHNSFGKNSSGDVSRFDRVRKVHISHDGFMNCTCGKTGEYLLPCVYICGVIDSNDYFSLSMFHVRWYKLLNQAVSGKCGNTFKNTEPIFREMIKITRESIME